MTHAFDALDHVDFAAHVGSSFEAGDLSLELVSAESRSATGGGAITGFSLLFRGALTNVLDQGMHKLKHATLGTGAIFITPVHDLDIESRYYEAVFQRIDPTRRAGSHSRTSP